MIRTVYLEAGDVATGIWCSRCLLPSALSVTVWSYTGDGADLAYCGTVSSCVECET